MRGALPLACLVGLCAGPALAQATPMESLGPLLRDLSESLGDDGGEALSGRLVQLIGLLTVLSIAPGLMIVMTCFTRFVIVLSMLRMALGLNQSPPNLVITSLALFLTFFVMQPVFQASWDEGLAPLLEGAITEEQAVPRIAMPFHRFMAANTREIDIALFERYAAGGAGSQEALAPPGAAMAAEPPDGPDDRAGVSWSVLVPAFMISELRRAFTIGFLIYLPFVAIDLIVASILMGAGMMMLSPVMISLPFKVIFFVLIDGWYMLAGSLIQSYAAY
ncbi:flagellar type III secretion system pore protein FliP [Marivita sp.]|uniref:flagellar type III secretion system pore protein FliP n=1 Tax=Marivita sp. TaxID=2003365 RepID=UPI0025C4E69A|nr:flagellar type III secretion system pore protein FliP [Marivita sp.]